MGSLVEHYLKHGATVGANSVSDYYNMANRFVDSGNYVTMSSRNGLELWNGANNTLAVTGHSGEIRSFYKVERQSSVNRLNKQANN